MASKTYHGVPVKDIITRIDAKPENVERIAGRSDNQHPVAVVEPDARWPEQYAALESRILAAFGDSDADGAVSVVAIHHVGSTSVPGLPAKAVIDIDLELSAVGPSAEAVYVPRLHAAGFEFRLREPAWYEHRFFAAFAPVPCNLHVFPPRCAQVARHLVFRDWLRAHAAARDRYAAVKRESAALVAEKGETMVEYTERKDWVIEEIRAEAFRALGFFD